MAQTLRCLTCQNLAISGQPQTPHTVSTPVNLPSDRHDAASNCALGRLATVGAHDRAASGPPQTGRPLLLLDIPVHEAEGREVLLQNRDLLRSEFRQARAFDVDGDVDWDAIR